MTFSIYGTLDNMMNLPTDIEFIFFNYQWKQHPIDGNLIQLDFTEYEEAAAISHELWKAHVSHKRSWA